MKLRPRLARPSTMAVSVSRFLTAGPLHIDPRRVGVELLSAANIVDLSDEFRFDERSARRAPSPSSVRMKRRKSSDAAAPIALNLIITQDACSMRIDLTAELTNHLHVLARNLFWEPAEATVTVQLRRAEPEIEVEEPDAPVLLENADEDSLQLDEMLPGVNPLTHREAQASAVGWALRREHDGLWETEGKSSLPCEPQIDAALELNLRLSYQCKGGVICLSLGAGKTLAGLCLVAARSSPAPMRKGSPDLPRVRTTLILAAVSNVAEGTWANAGAETLPRHRRTSSLQAVAALISEEEEFPSSMVAAPPCGAVRGLAGLAHP